MSWAPLHTKEQAAKRLGVSVTTLDRMIARRQIAHRKLGRLVRFTDRDIETAISRAEVKAV